MNAPAPAAAATLFDPNSNLAGCTEWEPAPAGVTETVAPAKPVKPNIAFCTEWDFDPPQAVRLSPAYVLPAGNLSGCTEWGSDGRVI